MQPRESLSASLEAENILPIVSQDQVPAQYGTMGDMFQPNKWIICGGTHPTTSDSPHSPVYTPGNSEVQFTLKKIV